MERLTTKFNSSLRFCQSLTYGLTSLFIYANNEAWACAYDGIYLSQIDRFCKRVVKYGYTARFTPITDVIRERDLELWKKETTNSHCFKSNLLP